MADNNERRVLEVKPLLDIFNGQHRGKYNILMYQDGEEVVEEMIFNMGPMEIETNRRDKNNPKQIHHVDHAWHHYDQKTGRFKDEYKNESIWTTYTQVDSIWNEINSKMEALGL